MRFAVQRRIRAAMVRLVFGIMVAVLIGSALSFLVAGLLVWSSQRIGTVPTLLAAGLAAFALAIVLRLIGVSIDRREERLEQALRAEALARIATATGRHETVLMVLALLLRLALDHGKPAKTERKDL
jgi:hypothetical protein